MPLDIMSMTAAVILKGFEYPSEVAGMLLPRLTEEGLMPRHIRHHFGAAAPEHVRKSCSMMF